MAVMLVIAMLVMTMVIMSMIIVVMMAIMIMRRMSVRRVIVVMAFRDLTMAAAGIGAAFGIERRLDLDDARAKPLHHRLDDVIAPDTQTLGHDLCRQMPIAEVPGDPDQMMRVAAANLDQGLRRRDDFDQTSIVEHQRVAAAQRDGAFEVEQELQTARARHRHPPPVTVVEIENDGIGRSLGPAILAVNLRRPDHAEVLTASRPCRR